jgi:Protein of unknown function (DUF1183).
MLELLILFLLVHCEAYRKILLKQIPTIYFYKDRLTDARRKEPKPQLICEYGHCDVTPKYIKCNNLYPLIHEFIWDCEDISYFYYVGYRANVSCEGYDYDEDEYVLSESCSLRYGILKNEYASRNQDLFNFIIVIPIMILLMALAHQCW